MIEVKYKCDECKVQIFKHLMPGLMFYVQERNAFNSSDCDYSSNFVEKDLTHSLEHIRTCMKKFKCNNPLEEHLRIHSGDKPYKCDQ